MTHKQKVLALLSDGLPHDHLSLYRLGCIAHSRIADLRKDGHDIVARRDGDTYWYQLATSLDAATDAPRSGSPSPAHFSMSAAASSEDAPAVVTDGDAVPAGDGVLALFDTTQVAA